MGNSFSRVAIFFISILLYPNSVLCIIYKNDILEFDLLDSWACDYEENMWTCSRVGKDPNIKQEIVVKIKRRGANDTLIHYLRKRKRQISHTQNHSKQFNSNLSTNSLKEILERKWVESLIVGINNKNEYDYFLATTEKNTAVFITFRTNQHSYNNIKFNINWILSSIKITPEPQSTCFFIPDENQVGGCIISGKMDCRK